MWGFLWSPKIMYENLPGRLDDEQHSAHTKNNYEKIFKISMET